MKSPTLALLEESGVAPTRENYLNLAFMGNPPSRLDPEEEAQLPKALQDGVRDNDKALFEKSQKKVEQAAKEAEAKQK